MSALPTDHLLSSHSRCGRVETWARPVSGIDGLLDLPFLQGFRVADLGRRQGATHCLMATMGTSGANEARAQSRLNGSSPLNDANQHHANCQDEQEVNETSERVRRDHPQ